MLKIAIACEGEVVTEHFGHCLNFTLFETEEQKIIKQTSVANPGHRPGFLPLFLRDLCVNVIIAGGMGGGAIDLFNEYGIEVIVGAAGGAEDNVKAYLSGELKSTGSVCHQHMHHGEC